MRDEQYKRWLDAYSGLKIGPQRDMVCRGHRVERDLHVNLDSEYNRDRCAELLETLEYTADDDACRTPLPGDLSIAGNRRAVMSNLRNAVKRYIEFREYTRG